ncbi:MAG: tandem-95 repeat protein, partial [Thermoanaerobaculia bacterium]
TETFTYTVFDGVASSVGTVTVTVTPVVVVNTPPTAVNDEATTAEDTALEIAVIANDTDADGDSLTVTAASTPGHGAVVINGATVTYTPATNWHGTDSFTYTVNDGNGASTTATVSVTVTPVNDAPVADDDTATPTQGPGPTGSDVLDNDSDVDGGSLSITDVTQPENGTVAFTATGVSYTPDAGFAGSETFTYTVSDGTASAVATVTVTVTPVNQAPQVVISDAEVDDDGVVTGLITVTDPDGPGLTVTPPTVAEGSVGVTNLGGGVFAFTFTPTQEARENAWATTGEDSVALVFTVSDGVTVPVTSSVTATISPVEPTTDPGGEYGTIDLTDLDLLTGISVTNGAQVYVIGSGSLDFDGDGTVDYDGFTLGNVNIDDQTLTPVVLLAEGDQPYDLAVGPNGWIYVADTESGVTAYDPANAYAPTTVTTEPATQVVYANDRLYVTSFIFDEDTQAGFLHIFDSDLSPIGSTITLDGLSAGLAVGPTGLLYITTLTFGSDPSEPTIGALGIYDADGTPVTSIPLAGTSPYGLEVDELGIAYVVDIVAQAIIAVDPEAGIVGTIDVPGAIGIDIGPDGLLYVTNQTYRSVDIFDPADFTSGPGDDTVSLSELEMLSGISVTTGGLVYIIGGDVGDFALGTVDVEDQTFTPVVLLAGSGQPFDLAVGPNGWIYVADTSSGVTAYDPANGYASTTVTTEPATQVVFANDRLYVTTYTSVSGIPTVGSLCIFDANLTPIGSRITLNGVSAGLAVGPTGQLYITTLTYANDPSQPPTSALNIYTADGAPVTNIPLTGILAYGVTVDDQGIAYVVNATGGRIMAVDPEVGIIGKINSVPGTLGIDIGPDGLLYVTNQISRSVDVLEIEIHPNLAPTVGTPAFGITSTGGWGTQYGTVNVADTDGDPLTFTLVSGSIDSEVGDVLVDPLNGSWVFTPTLQARFAAAAASDPVNATFTLLVTDGIDFVTVLVSAPITPYHNQAPQVSGLGFTIESIDPDSGVVSGYLSVSDADTNYYPEFGQLSYSVDGTITDALVQIDAAGRFTYTPSESVRVNAFISEDFDAAYFSVIVSDGESSVVVDVELPIVPLAVPTGDQGLAVAADGRMYFTSYLPHDGAGRVIVLNPDRSYITTINLATVLNRPFASAYDVVVGADGRIFVSSEVGASAAAITNETGTGAIVVINPDNDYVAAVFAYLDKPVSALAVGPDGRVYVANWNDDKIAVFNADGSSHSTITSGEITEGDDTGVAGLALGSDGRMYLTKPGLGAIKVISSNGSTVDIFDVGGSPWAIALAADGSAYVTDFDSTSVSVIGSNGNSLRTIRIPSGGIASDVTVAQDGTVLIAYATPAGSEIMAVSPTVPGAEPDATQLGDAILGEPIQFGALIAGDVLYQTTVRSGPDGQTSTSVTVIQPNGERFTFQAAGSPSEPAVLGPASSTYQTVTVYDASISAYRSGVLIVTSTGESRFTGLHAGTAVGSTIFGLDGTGYQILSSQSSDSGAYVTTVLVITPSGVSAHLVEGYPGSPLAGEFGVVVAPGGSVYLTTTSLTEPAGSESGFITTVTQFGPAGRLSAFSTAGFAGGPVAIAPDGAIYQTIGDVSVESGTGRAEFIASVAVVTAAGLIVLPQTSQGAPVGAAVITAEGHIYQTTVDVADIDAPADRLWHLLETVEPDSIAWAFERIPTAVEVVGDRIYIADSSGTLTILEDTGAFVASVYLGDESGSAAGAISDIAVDGNGRIYVANASAGMVWAFDPASTTATPDLFTIPGAMTLALSNTGKL